MANFSDPVSVLVRQETGTASSLVVNKLAGRNDYRYEPPSLAQVHLEMGC